MHSYLENYKFGSFEFAFTEDKDRAINILDIVFGLKRIRICPQRLLRFPN
jgi:hypothetical protein